MYPLPPLDNILTEQPVEFIEEVAGLYFRSIVLRRVGNTVPQHEHDHDHATHVGNGCARVWVNGVWVADYPAGRAIEIKAGDTHVFQALEPNTRLTCVHDIASAERIKQKEN